MFLILLFWLILGALCSYVAKQRGRRPYLWFILGFSMGFIALLLLFILPSKKEVFYPSEDVSKAVSPLDVPQTQSKWPSLASEEETLDPACRKLWYYLDEQNKQYGPMSFQALKRAFEEKTVHASTYVWNEDMDTWEPLKDLSAIMNHIQVPNLEGKT